MADPLLSTLCSICHIEPRKYKCPGCGVRTCSLPCIQKHKSRAACSGQRNPRAYIPAAQLRTQAGVDHDYNFLSSIERAKERLEKEILEDRRLLNVETLRPRDEDRQFNKVWHGDELRFTRREDGRQYKAPRFGGNEKPIRRRLRIMDIELVEMPKGLQRYNDNKTAFNRRTQSINWQVEWVIHDRNGQVTRILRKMLDETPLAEAVSETLRWHQAQVERDQLEKEGDAQSGKKRRRPFGKRQKVDYAVEMTQDVTTTAWPCTDYTFQSTTAAVWDHVTDAASVPQNSNEQAAEMGLWKFFLLKAGKGVKETALIPITSGAVPLHAVLSGRTIVEFPTIYVVPPGGELPEGFVRGSTERRARSAIFEDPSHEQDDEPPAKRQRTETKGRAHRPGKRLPGPQKKVAFGKIAGHGAAEDGENGEINSDGEDVRMRDDIGASSSSTESNASSSGAEDNCDEPTITQESSKKQHLEVPPSQRSGLVDYGSTDDEE